MASDSHRVFPTDPDERLRPFFARMLEPKPLRARTKPEWIQRRTELRPLVWKALGLEPAPDRLPLEIRTGACWERDGYTIQRIFWQTWPQVWAAGRLYVPSGTGERRPAVVNPRARAELAPALAKLGYVALAVDLAGIHEPSMGFFPMTVNTWTCLRALDLLAARPDVDRERLGLVGDTAAAVTAMFVMALDDRLKAASLQLLPAGLSLIRDPACRVPGLARFTDVAELCAIPSPRAIQFLASDEAPADHLAGELRAVYRLWQQPDRLDYRRFEGGIDLPAMREAAYTWLERELRGNRKAEAVSEPQVLFDDPEIPAAAGERPAEDRGEEGIRDWFRRRVVAQPPQLESKQSRRGYQQRVREEVRELLGEARAAALQPRVEERAAFRSEPDVRVPAVWLPGSEASYPVLVAAHPEGKTAALRLPLVRRCREAGWGILAPDLRFRGEQRPQAGFDALSWVRPEAGMAVDDLLACVQFLWEHPEADPRSVLLYGVGDQGLSAVIAAGLDERAAGAIVDCCGTTYRDGGQGLPEIPHVLRVADVPQLASLVAPRPLWLYNVPPERVGFSSRRYYDWTRRSFQSLGNEEGLKMTPGDLPDPGAVLDWFLPRLRKARKG